MAEAERAGRLSVVLTSRSRGSSFDFDKAKAAQDRLASLVRYEPGLLSSRLVAGLDVAYGCGTSFAAAAVVNREGMGLADVGISAVRERVPYVPSFLAFREAGPMISALMRLSVSPDALIVNGHGVAHPRRFGIASHVGVVLGMRSVGVAKRRLVGQEVAGSIYIGSEEVARVVNVAGLKLYVSVGHRVTLDEAVQLVVSMAGGHGKLPIPLQEAHDAATREARSCSQGSAMEVHG